MPYLWAWGFKSPLRHQMTRANALVIAVFGGRSEGSEVHLSAICQHLSAEARDRPQPIPIRRPEPVVCETARSNVVLFLAPSSGDAGALPVGRGCASVYAMPVPLAPSQVMGDRSSSGAVGVESGVVDAGEVGDLLVPGCDVVAVKLAEVIVAAGTGHRLHQVDRCAEEALHTHA